MTRTSHRGWGLKRKKKGDVLLPSGGTPSGPGRAPATPELARGGADSVCLRGHAPLHPTTLYLSSVRGFPVVLNKMRWMCIRVLFMRACMHVCVRVGAILYVGTSVRTCVSTYALKVERLGSLYNMISSAHDSSSTYSLSGLSGNI